ncbi:hypothetical protein [Nocardia sp. NBC_01009]|uniref:hypothetical protein n=1 Tax=Nocardia sp. NBC_01009 TaxID=2975996 RepID=UPI00386BBD88|nr:hypothetical protein OHA42_05125 [Nocardia sp. NBC_01009]
MAATETLCPFPINTDRACGRTVAQRSGPGRPRTYCDDPKHNAVNRLRADRRLAARVQSDVSDRPVSSAMSALVATLDRAADLKAQLLAELADAEQFAADVTDPELIALELESVRRDADARVAQALAAQAAAEHEAALARRERDEARAERDEALKLQEIAIEAAYEAIEARDKAADAVTRMRADCDRQIASVTAVADAELAGVHAERKRLSAVADKALNEVRELGAELATVHEDHRQLVTALTEQRARHLSRVPTTSPRHRRRTGRTSRAA